MRTFPERRQDILELLVALWEDWRPEVVFQPSHHDVHQDHQTIAQEGLRAFKRTTILGYEIPWNNFEFSYGAYVSLEKRHLERKVGRRCELRVATASPLRKRGVHLEPRPRPRHEREPRVRRGVPGLPHRRLSGTSGMRRRRLESARVLCVLGAVCMLAASLQWTSTRRLLKALMLAAAILFVPGAFVTLALVLPRRRPAQTEVPA